MEIRILFSLKPSTIKLSSLYAQRWLFIDTNLLIVMPSWLHSIIFLVVCEFADDCLTCMLHRNVAGCWRAWQNQSQEGSGGHEALCICGSWCFRHGWHMWVWSHFMLSKIRHENNSRSLRMMGSFSNALYALQVVDFHFQHPAFDIECMTQMGLLKKYMGNFWGNIWALGPFVALQSLFLVTVSNVLNFLLFVSYTSGLSV